MVTPSNSPLLPSMHCAGNFILEFPSINSPSLTLTHAHAKLVVCSTDLARMRHRENRRDREFMLGNSRMKLPDAMHAGQKRWVWRGRGLAAGAAPVVKPNRSMESSETIYWLCGLVKVMQHSFHLFVKSLLNVTNVCRDLSHSNKTQCLHITTEQK